MDFRKYWSPPGFLKYIVVHKNVKIHLQNPSTSTQKPVDHVRWNSPSTCSSVKLMRRMTNRKRRTNMTVPNPEYHKLIKFIDIFVVSGPPNMGGPIQRMTPPRGMVPVGPQVWEQWSLRMIKCWGWELFSSRHNSRFVCLFVLELWWWDETTTKCPGWPWDARNEYVSANYTLITVSCLPVSFPQCFVVLGPSRIKMQTMCFYKLVQFINNIPIFSRICVVHAVSHARFN